MHNVVYKPSRSSEKGPLVHWMGYLANRATKEVIWHAGSPTCYGAVEGPDSAVYTDACLVQDLAAGQRVVAAWLDAAVVDDGLQGVGGSVALVAALKTVKNCHRNGKPPAWIRWLSLKLQAAMATPTRVTQMRKRILKTKPKVCKHCRMEGCAKATDKKAKCNGFLLFKAQHLQGMSQAILSQLWAERREYLAAEFRIPLTRSSRSF